MLTLTLVALALLLGSEVYSPSLGMAATVGALAALLSWRRPDHLMSWIFLFIAFTQALVEFAGSYANYALVRHPGSLPSGDFFAWIYTWMWMPGLGVTATFMLLLFPDGRLPSRRWRWVARGAGLALLICVFTTAVWTWPLRGVRLLSSTGPPTAAVAIAMLITIPVLALCMVAGIASVALRYRRARGDEREQLKWITFAAVPLALAIVLSFGVGPVPTALRDPVVTVGVVCFPVAVAVAILKYRLYDIDVVINRTLVYGALAAFITGIYVAIVVGIGSLIGQGGKPNLALSILATAIVAVAFQPVRERVQKVANQLVYGKRATPYEVLSEFSGRMSETLTGDELLPRMARILGEGTGATRATIWLRRDEELRPTASWPDDATTLRPVLLKRRGAANNDMASSGEAAFGPSGVPSHGRISRSNGSASLDRPAPGHRPALAERGVAGPGHGVGGLRDG
ncbi:MAG: hypothetical protein ABR564_03215, partial [Candidatus Dormibacteria bacterium]